MLALLNDFASYQSYLSSLVISLVSCSNNFLHLDLSKRKKCASTSVVIELSLVLLSSTVNLWNRLIHSNTSVLY
ncbi:hypothetical protein NP493_9103g00000 [Ridgeia piscesae]|uniref:Uncharacterized protein n=1 Tax=Ridgeia piscesae TaxID=27915 RepID=A0AAD9IPR9_RIDPI|nr:hypothetical protein NP493_9103g00000 [Ridgeia piscesae]